MMREFESAWLTRADPGICLDIYRVRDYRGNALVTLGTITLALTIGFSFVVGDSRLPAWLSYGAVAVIGGFALSTLFFAVWRPRAPGRRAKR